MPIYEYQCESCEKVIEIWQGLSELPLTSCPSCEGQLKKIISMSSFQLKGGGWYADGYSSTPACTGSCPSSKAPCSTPSSTDTSKTETSGCGSC